MEFCQSRKVGTMNRNSPISLSSRMTQRQLLISIHIWLSDYIGERRSGIHTAVSQDVDKVFKGKTLNQLEMLEQSIKKKLKGGEGVDVGKLLLFYLVRQNIGVKIPMEPFLLGGHLPSTFPKVGESINSLSHNNVIVWPKDSRKLKTRKRGSTTHTYLFGKE